MATKENKDNTLCIAIDAGGVLLKKNSGNDQTDRSRFPIRGAKDNLTKLKKQGHTLVLVSFAGRKTAEITMNDMKVHYPGLFDKLFFVKNKLEKVAICRYIGADVMIDDTAEVLHNIKHGVYLGKPKIVPGIPTIRRILFTGDDEKDVDRSGDNHDDALVTETWEDIYEMCQDVKKGHVEDPSVKVLKYVYPEYSSVPTPIMNEANQKAACVKRG